jgi:hypothetical protein
MARPTATLPESPPQPGAPVPRRGPIGGIVAGSLVLGAVAALVLVWFAVAGAREHVITGTALLGFALGWAALALMSMQWTNQPQRWALVPADSQLAYGGRHSMMLSETSSRSATDEPGPRDRHAARSRRRFLTTILTTIAPCSGRFGTVRGRSVCRLTGLDGLRRTVANPRPTAGGQGSQVHILAVRQCRGKRPFQRNSERLLTASRGGLTAIRSPSPADARLLRPRAGTSPDRAPLGSAKQLRCGTAPISVGHWPTACVSTWGQAGGAPPF